MANGYATAQLDGGSYKVMMATYSGTGNEYDAYMVPTGVGNWNLTSDRPYYLQCIDATIEFSASEDQYIAKAHSIAPNQTSVAYVMQERAHSSATDNKTVRLVAYPTTTAPTFSVDIIDLGPITEPKLVPASISSVSSVTGTIDGGGQKTFTVSGGAAQVDLSQWWDSIGMGAHTVLLRSTLNGIQSGCKITFTKSTDLVSITTATYSSARRPASCRLIGNLVVPSGAVLTQEVTNNGNDASPTWEAYTGTEHFFSNETKTASQWGLAARVSIDNGKGSAVAEIKDSLAMGVVYEEE